MRQVMVGKKGKRYTKKGIKITTCVRCDEQATNQIQPEAEPDWWRPMCKNCGYALHKYVLEWLGVPEIDEKMLEYHEGTL